MGVTAAMQASADQIVTVIGRRMSRMRKVQVGVNAPIAEAAALFAKAQAGPRLTVYSAAMSGVFAVSESVSLFRAEWDALAHGWSFPIETVIDLMGGHDGIDDEPVHPLQIDAAAEVNLSGVLDPDGSVRLFGPGAAGTDVLPHLRDCALTAYLPRSGPRSMVDTVSIASGTRFSGPRPRSTTAFTCLVTDRAVLTHRPSGWWIESIHSGADVEDVRAAAGFAIHGEPPFTTTAPPTPDELALLARVDPHNLRTLEFLPSTQRLDLLVDLWRREMRPT